MPASALRPPSAATAARTFGAVLIRAVVGAAVATIAWPALSAVGETGTPQRSGRTRCPSPNPPDLLVLSAGTPQTAILGRAFASSLQVAFANSDGCPVTTPLAGIPVTFTAPPGGASGVFSASETSSATVGSDASGMALAPAFTAGAAAGSYKVTATSAFGSVSFSLTNVAASDARGCEPAAANVGAEATKLTVGVGARQSTPKRARIPIRLAVTVTDAAGNPLSGVPVTFMAPSRGPSGRFTIRSGRAPRPGSHSPPLRTVRARRAEVRSDSCGIALAPPFTANDHAGGYVVVASASSARVAFALVNEGG